MRAGMRGGVLPGLPDCARAPSGPPPLTMAAIWPASKMPVTPLSSDSLTPFLLSWFTVYTTSCTVRGARAEGMDR